jgi:hypothetical protein
MMEQQGTVLDGNLETLGLQATLKMLSLGGKTGLLSVVSGQERLHIALHNGHILSLDEPDMSPPDVVEVFRLLGRISRDDAALARQMAGMNPVNAMIFLTQRNRISPEDVQKHIEFAVIQALSRAVRWERGRFEFHREISSFQGRIGYYKPLNVDHVLLEAIRSADEREHEHQGGRPSLSRFAVPRWIPQFNGNVAHLGLAQHEVDALCLCNGQLPLYTLSYGLLIPEQILAVTLQRLLDLGLIEIVDPQLEAELQRSLMNLLTQSQFQLQHSGRGSIEQRLLSLAGTMITFTNGLIEHHGHFARALRGRGEVGELETQRYIESTFGPLIQTVQREFPRMDEIILFTGGRIAAPDIAKLNGVVRGQELIECYQDAVLLLSDIMHMVVERVLTDEAGSSRTGKQYEDIWNAFSREIDMEITQLLGRPVGTR